MASVPDPITDEEYGVLEYVDEEWWGHVDG